MSVSGGHSPELRLISSNRRQVRRWIRLPLVIGLLVVWIIVGYHRALYGWPVWVLGAEVVPLMAVWYVLSQVMGDRYEWHLELRNGKPQPFEVCLQDDSIPPFWKYSISVNKEERIRWRGWNGWKMKDRLGLQLNNLPGRDVELTVNRWGRLRTTLEADGKRLVEL